MNEEDTRKLYPNLNMVAMPEPCVCWFQHADMTWKYAWRVPAHQVYHERVARSVLQISFYVSVSILDSLSIYANEIA